MSVVLLAIGSRILREACYEHLRQAGHSTVSIRRPLAALTACSELEWSAAVVDGSDLGREALNLLGAARVIGLGPGPGIEPYVGLPLSESELLSTVERVTARSRPMDGLRVISTRRGASSRPVRAQFTSRRLRPGSCRP